ncbi:M20 family metallopeptidase [Bacillus massiliigorillae]|uniref:M20 family metallopeptidase n=1 Tax=Bacillus massiliigorillae TaxID=1243664 RepID=UPI0003A09568|nr:M20 family metallopeptidase [Bacillus massiliigorillae]
MSYLNERLEQLYPEMVELRRYFHQHPELSFHEVHTPKKIAEYLTNLGVEVHTGVGGRGVVGYIRGGKPGKTVALRADFDALPIQDEKDVPYKSTVPGVMHACGHDGHTTILLSVAKVLSEIKDELAGNVVLIHQFAEEIVPGGAKPMIEAGCLDGVDAIFGTHLWSPIPVGEIGYRSGAFMAGADGFDIEIIGRGGHGAVPHATVDPIALGTSIVQQLQQIVSRRIDPLKPAVLTVATFNAGKAFNVIPTTARISGTVRTFDAAVQDEIIKHMQNIIAYNCEHAGATYTFNYEKGYPAVINHEAETELLKKKAIDIIGEDNVKQIDPSMAAEDFSYYVQKVPGTYFFTGAGNKDTDIIYPHHHAKFDIDERSMLIAAKILASTAVDFLNNK